MTKLRPKKSLGQHFLHSPKALAKIIEVAHIRLGENILEIGPGTGILTRALLESGAKVIAVEKDQRSIQLLNDLFSKEISGGSLRLVRGDILDPLSFDFSIIQSSKEKSSLPHLYNYSVVANIPYYITGAILEKFLEHGPRPDRMVLLVQKEVAERIVSVDGKGSILSISVKAFGTPRIVAKVPREAFVPPPAVDSAILTIENISDARFKNDTGKGDTGVHIRKFFTIVSAGFAHKRKFLIKNLESLAHPEKLSVFRMQLPSLWKEFGLDLKTRAENLNVDQWISISERLSSTGLL